ncbi:IclR family transcriptional regulator [Lysinibacillus sp. 3P01SB]|uniref:IclR family transcriptional regulator n=1 Tax=Lysinibacillus sp. 3P01SB TaxID=3132284 RepID=UPI0039A5A7FE
MNNKNKTVVRSMDILNLFINYSELSFQEIITLSGMPKTSVYRMLATLEEMGFLEKGSDAKYRLGLLFLKFGHLVSSRLDIRKVAYPFMNALHQDTEEAINLIIREGYEAIYIEKIDTYQKVRLYTAIGRRSPLYAGACPRAILSFLPDEEINAYLDAVELKPIANGTVTSKDKLYEMIQQARAEGCTVSHSELENHTSAVAAPIYNNVGEVVAGLSIAGIEANYVGEKMEILKEKVKAATFEISRQLGYLQ